MMTTVVADDVAAAGDDGRAPVGECGRSWTRESLNPPHSYLQPMFTRRKSG